MWIHYLIEGLLSLMVSMCFMHIGKLIKNSNNLERQLGNLTTSVLNDRTNNRNRMSGIEPEPKKTRKTKRTKADEQSKTLKPKTLKLKFPKKN